MPYGLDNQGRPIFLISTMAMHTQNLRADPRASLLVNQTDAGVTASWKPPDSNVRVAASKLREERSG
jgi:putative heme iron utilization protein